jgi:hypothetical protein
MSIWTVAFWKGAAERLFWAFIAALVGVAITDGLDVIKADWKAVLLAALFSALFSVLKSMVVNATGAGPVGSASAVYDRPRDYGQKASDGS